MTIGHPFVERLAHRTHPLVDLHFATRQTPAPLAAQRHPLLFQAVCTQRGASARGRIATSEPLLHHLGDLRVQRVTLALPAYLPGIAAELFDGLFVDAGCWGVHHGHLEHVQPAMATPPCVCTVAWLLPRLTQQPCGMEGSQKGLSFYVAAVGKPAGVCFFPAFSGRCVTSPRVGSRLP